MKSVYLIIKYYKVNVEQIFLILSTQANYYVAHHNYNNVKVAEEGFLH